ncbi:hypothetical protein ES695_02155 [Candidatus Atribacteria bacterium 1244-E10-H5-B2]|nr:MAG: hypothetical protein ES695_02155 [Candidatus Atribacteria bacterium 1244-E10-H5-B2]
MAIMTYGEFKAKYQHGYGLATSTKLRKAYRQYQLHGTLPAGAEPIEEEVEEEVVEEEVTPEPTVEPTPTPTVTPTLTVEEQIALMPEVPTPVAPALAPAPEVTPAPTFAAPVVPTIPTVTPAPTIPAIEVTPAPEYAPTEEEKVWAEMYGGTIADIIKARGEGIPEETINLMIRQQFQMLTAREDENLRIMHNDMERRGITNSGLVFWNQQKIKSATTTALANSITDIQIRSALMKMASFENALGHAGQFLGYLQEQSKMVYVGKMATWEAQTQANLIQYQAQISADMDQWKMVNQFNLADWQANTQALFAQWDKNSTAMIEAWKMDNVFSMTEWTTRANYDMAVFQIETEALMAKWSAQMDIYKLGISQAYLQDNMNLQAQINEQAAEQQHIWDLEMAEIEAEAANQVAATTGFWSMVGTTAGIIFKIPGLGG